MDGGSVPVLEAAGSLVQGPLAAFELPDLLDRPGHPAGFLGIRLLLPTGSVTKLPRRDIQYLTIYTHAGFLNSYSTKLCPKVSISNRRGDLLMR